jgi:hypothetical protein
LGEIPNIELGNPSHLELQSFVFRSFPPFPAFGTPLVTLSATAAKRGSTQVSRSNPMFDYEKIRRSAAAAMLAIVLSTTAIAAAVGPARAVETGPSLYASAPAATTNA